MVKLTVLTLALVALSLALEHQVDAVPTATSMFSCTKEYVVGLLRDKLFNKSTLIADLNKAVDQAQARYAQAEARGELKGKDDTERSAFHYKLVIEELRRLRGSYESGQLEVKDEDSKEDKLISSCVGVSENVEKKTWTPDVVDTKDEDDRELELQSELDQLEHLASNEDQMGMALSPEVREQLKTRTVLVLKDLLNNEVRQLVLSVVSAYLAGGPISGVFTAVSGSLKFKLVEFLMNGALDVISSLMGRRLEVKPVDELKPSPYKEISADDLVANAKLAN